MIMLNTMRLNLQTMSVKHRLFFSFIAGIILGTVIMNSIIQKNVGYIGIYNNYIMNFISEHNYVNIDIAKYFLFCTRKYSIESIVIVFMCGMPIGKYLGPLFCIYKGILVAFLISGFTILYGVGGALIYILSVFPHYFTYIPMVMLGLYIGEKIRKNRKDKKIIKYILKGLFIMGILIVITAILESYCNFYVIRQFILR